VKFNAVAGGSSEPAPNLPRLFHVSTSKGGRNASTEKVQQFKEEVEFQKEIQWPQILEEGRPGSTD
jgi:hypothetical protein